MSVPNQCVADGHLSRLSGDRACGSTVPSHGANIAIATMISRSPPPTTIVGCRLTVRHTPRRGTGGTPASGRSVWAMVMPLVSDARVEQRIAQIDQQVDQHIDARK